jgi:23S rRNA pseudouridine2605 synthase
MPEGTRINKFLASCGLGSRRDCDALVMAGRVQVNGRVATPATRVAEDDHVKLDGRRVQARHPTTILFHKPRGYVCSKEDELGRPTIYSLLPPKWHHLNHVGRLDLDSEGLLVLTNDGDLAQRLSHPSNRVEKEYLVSTGDPVPDESLARISLGVHTAEGKLAAKAIYRLGQRRFAVVLDHGIKRQIRLMFEALGHSVSRLSRVRIGSLADESIAPGDWRVLDHAAITILLSNPRKSGPGRGGRQLRG